MRFIDRTEAGELLAAKLQKFVTDNTVIYALPRGGVETAAAAARLLDVPLDLIIARKIGHPASPEYAIGAVTETGPAVWNEAERTSVDRTWLRQAEATERSEAKRRRQVYLAGRKPISASGKVAVLVDDGIATGYTMQAAVAAIIKQRPTKVIVAVPCAPRETINSLLDQGIDDCIVLTDPDAYLGAVSPYYANFPQLSDKEVIDLLAETAI